jgi:type 1 glutamine amidotransferase
LGGHVPEQKSNDSDNGQLRIVGHLLARMKKLGVRGRMNGLNEVETSVIVKHFSRFIYDSEEYFVVLSPEKKVCTVKTVAKLQQNSS